jgi:Zn-dependent protease
MDLSQIIIVLPILLFSVIVHEIAHGWTALRCGDPTARDAGRLTFNPIPHIDPFMTIILPLLLIVSGTGFVIGGAKPVPVNPYLFRGGERDNVLVSASGAVANLLLALAAFLLSLVAVVVYRATGSALLVEFLGLLNIVISINLLLANFNLLPIPPLDGSHILAYFLKGEAKVAYLRFSRYGFMVLIGVIFLGDLLPIPGGLFSLLFAPTFAVRDFLIRLQVGFLV